jgi:hypothetical protein
LFTNSDIGQLLQHIQRKPGLNTAALAEQSMTPDCLDCHAAIATRNDGLVSFSQNRFPHPVIAPLRAVIASGARQSMTPRLPGLPRRFAPRNDDQRGSPCPQTAWIATPLPRLATTTIDIAPTKLAALTVFSGDLYGQD